MDKIQNNNSQFPNINIQQFPQNPQHCGYFPPETTVEMINSPLNYYQNYHPPLSLFQPSPPPSSYWNPQNQQQCMEIGTNLILNKREKHKYLDGNDASGRLAAKIKANYANEDNIAEMPEDEEEEEPDPDSSATLSDFLLQLLSSEKHKNLIAWNGKQGKANKEFKLHDVDGLARMWRSGKKFENGKFTRNKEENAIEKNKKMGRGRPYGAHGESLLRSLYYYCKKGVLRKNRQKRMVWTFLGEEEEQKSGDVEKEGRRKHSTKQLSQQKQNGNGNKSPANEQLPIYENNFEPNYLNCQFGHSELQQSHFAVDQSILLPNLNGINNYSPNLASSSFANDNGVCHDKTLLNRQGRPFPIQMNPGNEQFVSQNPLSTANNIFESISRICSQQLLMLSNPPYKSIGELVQNALLMEL